MGGLGGLGHAVQRAAGLGGGGLDGVDAGGDALGGGQARLQRLGLGLGRADGGGDLAAQLGHAGAELVALDGVGGQLDGDRGRVLVQRRADLGELRQGGLGGGAELLALALLGVDLLLERAERLLRGAQLVGGAGSSS